MSKITRLLQNQKHKGRKICRSVRRRIHVHLLSVTGLKIKSPLTLRVLPFPPTLRNVKNKKRSQTNDQTGKRCAAVQRETHFWVPAAHGPRSASSPGRTFSCFLALQPGTGILLIRQAEVSFSERQPCLARWKCRPKLVIGEDKMGPSEILGFGRGIRRLGPSQRKEWPGFAGIGGWNMQNHSCRTVQAR